VKGWRLLDWEETGKYRRAAARFVGGIIGIIIGVGFLDWAWHWTAHIHF
jgi:hypothetical protein